MWTCILVKAKNFEEVHIIKSPFIPLKKKKKESFYPKMDFSVYGFAF